MGPACERHAERHRRHERHIPRDVFPDRYYPSQLGSPVREGQSRDRESVLRCESAARRGHQLAAYRRLYRPKRLSAGRAQGAGRGASARRARQAPCPRARALLLDSHRGRCARARGAQRSRACALRGRL
eukprot:Amastigsp_a681642_29.p3 type:complete len:129 gc:universal Amastigsp_a681642_29:191-577(+)